MVHHVCLLETNPDVSDEKLEEIMVQTRIRLLKILPELSNLRVGKRIDPANSYTYFFSFDVESMDKLEQTKASAVYTQYQKQIIDAYANRISELDYEMEPGKDIRYS
ncbi:MAG: Dabb family protein [Verrucomicrobiota bacterium]